MRKFHLKIMGLALLAFARPIAAQPPQPPHGVNDSVLGTEAQFRLQGPGRICLRLTSVDLRPDESASLYYSGIHFAVIRVAGPHGAYLVKEGESWAEPRNPQFEEDWRGRTIARVREDGRPHYMIYAPSPYDEDDRELPTVWVEGEALGRSHDSEILNRILVYPNGPPDCLRQFNFGWGVIFGDEPLERHN